jgi:hypothetical protein
MEMPGTGTIGIYAFYPLRLFITYAVKRMEKIEVIGVWVSIQLSRDKFYKEVT